jgi:hypothetical protein
MESVVKGDRPMGMKAYAGDLDRLFGIGGHGTGAKGETVPPAPAHHSSFQKGAIPKRGSVFEGRGKQIQPPQVIPPSGVMQDEPEAGYGRRS